MANQARAERPTSSTSVAESQRAAEVAAQAGLDKKAEDVRILDIRGLASYADFLVVMTAGSDRQVSAIADAVDEELRKLGHRPIGVEGQAGGNWILIDTGDIVVHVFNAESRGFYDLDGLWSDAKRLTVTPQQRVPVSAV
jgi:ribosome-associated protein